MPPFFPKPPPPFPRPQNLFICSIFTLNKSLKNYPKHFKCLKIETQGSKYGDYQILSKSRLKELQRRAKSLKLLDLEKHKQFFKLKIPQAFGLLKSCKNLSSLTLFENVTYKDLSDDLDLEWFTLGYLPNSCHNSGVHRSQNSFLLKSHLIRSHKRPKLLPRGLLKSLGDIVSQFEVSPSTSNKLLNSRKSLLTRFRFNLSHLQFKLSNVTLPLPFNVLLYVLKRLPDPHKIIHLTAFAPDASDQNDHYALKLRKVLNYLQSLRSLNLGIHSFLSILTLSKFLKAPLNLREISLSIPIQQQKELIELALFIASLKNLSLLAIVNSKSIQEYVGKGHRIFFNQISGLTQLKSLEISLSGEDVSSLKSELFHGCLGEFAGCVERLHELQEIRLTQSEFAIAPEFDSLADALEKKGSKLKKFEIKFVNEQKKIDHLKELNKAFKTMENLEELSLENLWTQKGSLIQFGEIISELKWIKSVKLDGEYPSLKKADLLRTLEKILMKYGLEELKWFGKKPIYEMKSFRNAVNSIDIKQIILRNPRLHSVCLDCDRAENKDLIFKNVKGFLP